MIRVTVWSLGPRAGIEGSQPAMLKINHSIDNIKANRVDVCDKVSLKITPAGLKLRSSSAIPKFQ